MRRSTDLSLRDGVARLQWSSYYFSKKLESGVLESTQNERLVMFSDAVVAITITLLVLDIRLPAGAGDLNDTDLWRALAETGPSLLGYLISFAVIGAFWLGHQQKFSVIVRAARGLMVLNLLFLCCIGIVPFVTSLLAENPGVLATQVYAAVMSACAFMLAMIWLFAILRGLIDVRVSRREQWRNFVLSLLSTAVFVLSIPIAKHDPDLAKYAWLLLLPLSFLQHPTSHLPGGVDG